MATGKEERKGTSLCRESTSVGTLVGDQTKTLTTEEENPYARTSIARSTSVSTCTAGAR